MIMSKEKKLSNEEKAAQYIEANINNISLATFIESDCGLSLLGYKGSLAVWAKHGARKAKRDSAKLCILS